MSDNIAAPAPEVSSTPSTSEAAPTPETSIQENQTSQEQVQEARKFKLKAQGREMELSEEDLLKHASMGLSAQEKWQEAAQLRKANEAFLRQLQSDPLSVLQNPALGLDIKQIAMDLIRRDLEEGMLSPEEKRQRDMEQELEGYRSKGKAEQERVQREQQAQADQQWAESTKASVVDGLKATGLPYTQFTWNSTLQYMAAAIDAGYDDVSPEQVMHLVKRDYQQAFESFYQLPPDQLLQHLGQQNIDKIQQAVISKAKGTGFQSPKAPASESAGKPQQSMRYEDFLKEQKAKLLRGE